MCFSPQVHAIFRHHNFQKLSAADVFRTFSLQNALFATAACNFSTSQLQKVLRDRQFFNIYTSECASRHSGVHFFRHMNFKKCSEHEVFCTFSLPNVRFATAACNFSTSELTKVLLRDRHFLTCSLPNVRFATATCNFSTSELQKVLRDRQFFNIFTSKCAFRHSGVQFLISPLSTYLRTRRFNRPIYFSTDPTHESLKKHSISRLR